MIKLTSKCINNQAPQCLSNMLEPLGVSGSVTLGASVLFVKMFRGTHKNSFQSHVGSFCGICIVFMFLPSDFSAVVCICVKEGLVLKCGLGYKCCNMWHRSMNSSLLQ